MFLSRVRLNPTRRQTRKLLTSAQALHATVLGSHPPDGEGDRDGGRVLWRLDQPSRHDLQLYVVSPVRPDFTGLLEGAGWPSTTTWDCTGYHPFLARLAAGQRWHFKLTANPVRSVKRGEAGRATRGTVSPHLTVEQQERWLISRASAWGFHVPENTLGALEVRVGERHTASFARRSEGGDGGRRRDRVAITRASYEGQLEILDADALRLALTAGMGRAKAYGCGLMTLAPVR